MNKTRGTPKGRARSNAVGWQGRAKLGRRRGLYTLGSQRGLQGGSAAGESWKSECSKCAGKGELYSRLQAGSHYLVLYSGRWAHPERGRTRAGRPARPGVGRPAAVEPAHGGTRGASHCTGRESCQAKQAARNPCAQATPPAHAVTHNSFFLLPCSFLLPRRRRKAAAACCHSPLTPLAAGRPAHPGSSSRRLCLPAAALGARSGSRRGRSAGQWATARGPARLLHTVLRTVRGGGEAQRRGRRQRRTRGTPTGPSQPPHRGHRPLSAAAAAPGGGSSPKGRPAATPPSARRSPPRCRRGAARRRAAPPPPAAACPAARAACGGRGGKGAGARAGQRAGPLHGVAQRPTMQRSARGNASFTARQQRSSPAPRAPSVHTALPSCLPMPASTHLRFWSSSSAM